MFAKKKYDLGMVLLHFFPPQNECEFCEFSVLFSVFQLLPAVIKGNFGIHESGLKENRNRRRMVMALVKYWNRRRMRCVAGLPANYPLLKSRRKEGK